MSKGKMRPDHNYLDPQITWHDNNAHWQSVIGIHLERLAAGIAEIWGERCPDYFYDCACCQKWRAFDELAENPFD